MKILFKIGFLALALSLGITACSEKKADGADSTITDTSMTDTTMTMSTDSTMADTMKKDSVPAM